MSSCGIHPLDGVATTNAQSRFDNRHSVDTYLTHRGFFFWRVPPVFVGNVPSEHW
jgi:hypothetical protein